MPPKKRVVAKGPFYFFMVAVQDRRRRLYGQCSLEEAKEHAGAEWKNLTVQAKQIYEDMAKEHKKLKGDLYSKFTSDGRPIALVLKEEEEKIKMKENMVLSIGKYVSDIGSLDDIKQFKFYIVSFNILCEVRGDYPPLEVGLIEYTIQYGFTRSFHRFINPGEIPLGFASSAKDHSEATHGIPITGFQEGESNYGSVVKSVVDFLRPFGDGILPPLFCPEDHIPQVEGCFRWLDDRTGCVPEIVVWDIMHLLLRLRTAAGMDLSVAEAESILNSAIFDYEVKSLCSYHADIDNKNCALGQCRRLGYKLSNALLGAYGVSQSIPYQHLPPRIDPTTNFHVTQLTVKQARGGKRGTPSPRPAVLSTPQPNVPPPTSTIVPLSRSVHAEYEDEKVVVPSVQALVSTKQKLPYSVEYSTASEAVMAGGSNACRVPSLVGDEFPSLSDSLKDMKVSKSKGSDRTENPSAVPRLAEPQSCSFSLALSHKEGQHADVSQRSVTEERVLIRPARIGSRIAAQFTMSPSNLNGQGLGRGAPAKAHHLPQPGKLGGIPRCPNTKPNVFMEKIAGEIPSRGLGRGSAFLS